MTLVEKVKSATPTSQRDVVGDCEAREMVCMTQARAMRSLALTGQAVVNETHEGRRVSFEHVGKRALRRGGRRRLADALTDAVLMMARMARRRTRSGGSLHNDRGVGP